MLGRGDAVGAGEALNLLLRNLPSGSLPEMRIALEDSYGMVASRDIFSPEDLPGFARSTVDGFAVSAADTFGASEGSPAYLAVPHEIPMGEVPVFELKKGEAARISTGGMLPSGADAVVMIEHTASVGGGDVETQRAVAPGENVIQRSEDVGRGDLVLRRGRRLRPQDVAVLAGVGFAEVHVYERPKVSIISTGDEVAPAGAPIGPGLVRDMNSYNLAGLILQEGGLPLRQGIIKDDFVSLKNAVSRSAMDSALVLVSGGSSVGARDLTARVVAELGRALFHGVSIKPGKPLLAGIVGDTPVFGLPGHPRAVTVCFEAFIRPVLGRLSGVAAEQQPRTVRARLLRGIHSSPGRQDYFSVAIEEKDGELWARPLLGKSGLMAMLIRADGTLVVPPEKLGYERGEMVEIRLP